MTLRGLLHSACHVLGYQKESNNMQYCNKMAGYQNEGHDSGVVQSSKVSNSDLRSQSAEMQLSSGFRMPLHYPRYKKADYEKMEEWKVDMLLREYGLSFEGSLDEKRAYAMGAFLWP
ncbi:hypothetical protein DITRI_Ditri19aG0004100 [Diplodiscus trichospermus]